MQAAAAEAENSSSADGFDSLWEACRNQTRSQMEDLAQRIDANADWDELVLPEMQKEVLLDIVAQVRHRSTVYDAWGFAGKGKRGLGISVLFAGPSGTGKTMAAEVLAASSAPRSVSHRSVVGRQQVHRRDGEELAPRLRRRRGRRRGPAVRRGRRAVREAQRGQGQPRSIREHRSELSAAADGELSGLAILTTNMKSALDTAFLRRIRFVVQFPFPDAEQRAEIWRRIFPANHQLKAG